ncbi:MAG: hypothetical protein C0173_09220 [Desulfurella sp.]|nr:MAG: hypothetical protein C0173_09220 [Desulfurella sp.]
MVRKKVFNEIKGFDEGYPEALNDIDLCLSLRKKGYLVVWTPHAVLYHYESKSRGFNTGENSIKRYNKEVSLFKSKWQDILQKGDPYYNPNLTLNKTDFSIVDYSYEKEDENYSSQGIFYLRTGKIEEAKEYFQKALNINPNNPDALFCLGVFYLKEGKVKKSLEYFNLLLNKDLLKLKVQLGCLYNNIGVAYIKLGNVEEGFKLIEQALDLNPMYMDAQYNLEQKNKNSYDFKITRKLII